MTPQSPSQGLEGWPARSFLGGLSEPVRTKLLGVGTRCRYVPEEILIREGDLSNHVVLLRSGFVKVTARLDNGHEALLAIRVGGDIVGEMAAMDDGAPRSATVTACGEIVASIVRESDLRSFLESHPEAARAVNRIVVQRLRWSNQRRLPLVRGPSRDASGCPAECGQRRPAPLEAARLQGLHAEGSCPRARPSRSDVRPLYADGAVPGRPRPARPVHPSSRFGPG
ncbi:Crp/Fnr family transcriptional regulator [Streptomyces sp. NPDC001668]|uniref:Crp/Fnr family transcriptional regulator n=1 Tax=unclassified Streptomyces TaxID=2593676 RepID=UPI003695023A